MENAANPLDPRFGRCPSSSAAASQRDPHYSTPPPPPRGGYHRRVHSETFLRLPDDFLFDSDHDFSLTDIEFPSISNENGSNSNSSAGGSSFAGTTATAAYKAELEEKKPVSGVHLRSLSLDAAYFEELEFQAVQVGGGGEGGMLDRKVRHRHSRSMDVSTSPLEAESSGPMDFAKKAMPANKLADLALLDPKRAKRILANRQSAARSKERKNRYTSELERKVQTLQMEATTLSAQLTLLQKDTANLAYENTELKLRLQDMEQQAHLRDALNEVLRDDVQRLKIATGQIAAANGNTFNRGIQQLIPHYLPHAQQIHIRDTSQTQQLHVSQPSSCNQPQGGQPSAESMDFM